MFHTLNFRHSYNFSFEWFGELWCSSDVIKLLYQSLNLNFLFSSKV